MRKAVSLMGLTCALTVASAVTAGAGQALQHNDGRYLALQFTQVGSASSATSPEASLREKTYQLAAGLQNFGDDRHGVQIALDYQYTHYEYAGLSSRNRDLHRLQLPLRWRWRNGDWAYRGFVAPGISTSSNVFKDPLRRATRDDLLMTARFEARRTAGAHTVFAGAAYDRLFGEPALYPVGGIEFRSGDRWRARLALPDPGLDYRLSARHALALRLFPAGHRWHVVADDFASDFSYVTEAYRARLTWSAAISSGLFLDVIAGYEFNRHHRLVDDLGIPLSLDVDNAWLLGVAVRLGQAPQVFVNGANRE